MPKTAKSMHDLEDRAADGDRVAPLLLVGDAEAAGAEAADDEQAGRNEVATAEDAARRRRRCSRGSSPCTRVWGWN